MWEPSLLLPAIGTLLLPPSANEHASNPRVQWELDDLLLGEPVNQSMMQPIPITVQDFPIAWVNLQLGENYIREVTL